MSDPRRISPALAGRPERPGWSICGSVGDNLRRWRSPRRRRTSCYYGDNLEFSRQYITDDSVDLVYLDPPFNSNREYNVIFGKNESENDDDTAQIQAFNDTWRWTPVTDDAVRELRRRRTARIGRDALTAFRTLLGENDAMAYLVNMAPRLRGAAPSTQARLVRCTFTATRR